MPQFRRSLHSPLSAALLAAGLSIAAVATATEHEPSGHVAAIRIAPQPAAGMLGEEYRPVRLWPVGAAVQKISAALEKPCEHLVFAETPLREAVAMIAERTGIGIAFDHGSLEDAGVDPETPVTAHFKEMPFRSALRALLRDVELTALVRDDRLVVTTLAEAHEHPVRAFYPVLPGEDPDDVVAIIERTIAPHTWDTVGGPGTIAAAPASIGWGVIVSHDAEVHEQVEALMRECDQLAWQPPGPTEAAHGHRPRHIRAYDIDDDVARSQLAEELVDLCNQALPDGGDPDARVLEIGRSLVVQSRSRPFHLMAAQLVTAVTGVVELMEVEVDLPEADENPGPDRRERPDST
jgi:hypothetical protein